MRSRWLLALLVLTTCSAAPALADDASHASGVTALPRLLARAGEDTGHAVYPGGDLDPTRGVCTDVVIRALRGAGIDLQSRVHEDILRSPNAYASMLTRGRADANIDHRRVGPLKMYFDRHAA